MRAGHRLLAAMLGCTAVLVSGYGATENVPAIYTACLAEGRAEAGIRACDDALANTALSDEQRATALLALGAHQRRNGQPEVALNSLAQAAALAPDLGAIQSEMAVAHHLMGNLDAARAGHERAFALGPVTLRMFNNRGVTLLAAGDAAGAVADFDAALAAMIEGGTEAGDLWNNRANARCQAGEVDGSVEDRLQALYAQRFTAAAAQSGLRKTGFYEGPADGIWAQPSDDALRAWTAAGCPDAPKTHFL